MRSTLYPNWMVAWNEGREPRALFFELASEAWKAWEKAEGTEIGIYRRREVKRSRTGSDYVEWQMVDYHPQAGSSVKPKAAAK